jgi:transposase
MSAGAVGSVVARARQLELSWADIGQLDDDELEQRLYGPKLVAGAQRPLPEPSWIHTELRRKGVTLELLHVEYLQEYPDGYRYTAFCEHYRRWSKQRGLSMRQIHKAGEKTFVDYSGAKPTVVDRRTGEVCEVELFVAVLGASNFTFAEATRTQQLHDFIASNTRAIEYFGGVTVVTVPDQLKSAVTKPCRYEPVLNRTYRDWGDHVDTAIIPARPKKPKDKAKVEVGVQIAQRWILARLRNETFFSLVQLNARIAELLEELNDRPMRDYGQASRRQLFERLDRPELKPLPASRFVYCEWETVKANIDYHVQVAEHYYSVPYSIGRVELEARLTATTVEIYGKSGRIASHIRSYQPHRHTTKPEHMPKSHRAHLEWTPSRLISWGAKIGPSTEALVKAILASRPHPEQGYRSCLGLLRLAKRYDEERLEVACKRAHAVGAVSYRHVAAILKNNLDRLAAEETTSHVSVGDHGNIRGAAYYEGEQHAE